MVVADTASLRTEVESVIRLRLAEMFGQPFASQILTLPAGARREFDAVSSDGTVVVAIKTSSGLTSGGNLPPGKINSCITDLYYLSLLDAPSPKEPGSKKPSTRLLVLTNPEFFKIFMKRMKDAIAPGISVVHMPLGPKLQKEVDAVILQASREMGPLAVEAAAVAAEEQAEVSD